jgi:hypothetical protein
VTIRVRELISLRHSTGETDQGPELELRRGALIVRYDAEDDTGVVWTRLRFSPAFGARFTSAPTVEVWMIDAYSKICEVDDSAWIEELTARAREGRGALANARHFFVYFDDFGCIEVAAGDLEVVIENGG